MMFGAPGESIPDRLLERLRAIPENGWTDVDDPLAELRKIRHGEENTTQ